MFSRIKKGTPALLFGIACGILLILAIILYGYPGSPKFFIVIFTAAILSGLIHAFEMNGDTKYFKKIVGLGAKSRIPQLDYLRVIAAVGVMMTHAIQLDINQNLMPNKTAEYIYTVVYMMHLICNPLYVMLSGALLLKYKEEKLSDFYLKRVNKVAIPMVVYYLFAMLFNGYDINPVSMKDTAIDLYVGNTIIAPHYWLMYTLLSFYIIVPFLRYMIKGMSYKMLTSVVWISLIFMTLNTYVHANIAVMPIFALWTGVAIIGYWFIQPETRKYDKLLMGLGVVAAAIMAVYVYNFDDFIAVCCNCSPTMVLQTLGVCAFVYSGPAFFRKSNPVIQVLSFFSYSIILLHWVMLMFVQNNIGLHTFYFGYVGGYISYLLAMIVVCLLYGFLIDNTVVILCQKIFTAIVDAITGLAGRRGHE